MSGIVEVMSNRFAQAGFGTIEGSSDMRQGRHLKDERLMCDPSPNTCEATLAAARGELAVSGLHICISFGPANATTQT